MLINVFIGGIILITAWMHNTDNIVATGVEGLAIRSHVISSVAASNALATLIFIYEVVWLVNARDKRGVVKRRTQTVNMWMSITSALVLCFSTLVVFSCAIVLKIDGKRAFGLDTEWSYGQAYAVAAATALLMSLGLQYMTEYTTWGAAFEAEVSPDVKPVHTHEHKHREPDQESLEYGYVAREG